MTDQTWANHRSKELSLRRLLCGPVALCLLCDTAKLHGIQFVDGILHERCDHASID